MSQNSSIIGRLVSLYRGVIRRQRIGDARRASIACLATPCERMGNLESLETRVMLSTVTLPDVPRATYTGSPSLLANMQTVLAAGINKVADAVDANSAAGNFSTDIPGILKYTTFGQAPTAVNLSTLLASVGGVDGLIKSNVANAIGALASGSPITALNLPHI